jgi:hypothetical protein
MPSNNRKVNYRRLREAGFTAKEAQRFKDYGDVYVEKLINMKEAHKQFQAMFVSKLRQKND